MSGEQVDAFEVGRATSWVVKLGQPVQEYHRVVVGFIDSFGTSCPVDYVFAPGDRTRILVNGRSGLPMRGTITVGFINAKVPVGSAK